MHKVEPQEDGQFCVFKTLPIESIEKTAVQQCVHRFVFVYLYLYLYLHLYLYLYFYQPVVITNLIVRVDKQCYFSYTTTYTPTTEDVCSENYKKKCFIEYTQTRSEHFWIYPDQIFTFVSPIYPLCPMIPISKMVIQCGGDDREVLPPDGTTLCPAGLWRGTRRSMEFDFTWFLPQYICINFNWYIFHRRNLWWCLYTVHTKSQLCWDICII